MGEDVICGGAGHDITGRAADDSVFGEDGQDKLNASSGRTPWTRGQGKNDTYGFTLAAHLGET